MYIFFCGAITFVLNAAIKRYRFLQIGIRIVFDTGNDDTICGLPLLKGCLVATMINT